MPPTVAQFACVVKGGGMFEWHPDPALLDFRSPDSRAALSHLGAATWELSLDYLFDEALARPVGPDSYPEMRARFFGPGGVPGPAPVVPASAESILDEVRSRLLPYMFNSQNPGAFAYFTPP